MAIRSLRVSVLLVLALLLVLPPGSPRAASVKREMGFAVDLAEKGLWNEAAHRFLALLKREPHNPRLWNDLAVSYEAMGEYDKAHEAYDKAVTLMANPPDTLLANQEAFEAFYRVWRQPSVAEQPPLMDPRVAGAARPVKPALPAFPGPDFDDADQPGGEEIPRPIFPDEEAEAADPQDMDDSGQAEPGDASPPAPDEPDQPAADDPDPDPDPDDESLADPYPTGDDPPVEDPPAEEPQDDQEPPA